MKTAFLVAFDIHTSYIYIYMYILSKVKVDPFFCAIDDFSFCCYYGDCSTSLRLHSQVTEII